VDLHLDADGSLWVATRSGLNRYDPDDERFDRHQLNNAKAFANAQLTAVLHDATGVLWIGTRRNGLFAVDGESLRHFSAQVDNDASVSQGLPSNKITALAEDGKGNLWVGTDGGGFARFDRRTEHFVIYRAEPQGLSSDHITRLYEDPQQRLWVATRDAGLNSFDPNTQTFTQFRASDDDPHSLSSDAVTDILSDSNGSIWVATEAGLNELTAAGRFARYLADPRNAAGLRSDHIARLHQDSDGVLWIATDKGIERWNYLSDTFRYLGQAHSEQRVSAVTECPDGQLWIGTRSKGIAQVARDSGALKFVPAHARKVRALLCDSGGTLWVGTADAGLQRLAPGTDTQSATLVPVTAALGHQKISTLASDPSGTLWAGTPDKGLLALDRDAQGTLQLRLFHADSQSRSSLDSNQVTALFIDADQQLWVGTGNGQISLFDADSEEFSAYSLNSDRGQRAPADLLQSKNGDLWIATSGSGLLRWPAEQRARNEASFTHFTKASGLPSNHLRALLEDQTGQLWVSSNRGMVRFDPATLKLRHFDRMNGLRGDQFYPAAKLISRNGQLLFGGKKGLMGFYPSAISQLKSEPRLTLSAHNRSAQLLRTFSHVEQPASLTLPASTDYVEFRFAALQHVAANQNNYQYQLEGFDQSWHSPNASQSAIYTSLPAGDYVFRVRASNPEGIWGDQGASVELQMLAPVWRNSTAKLIYTLLAVTLLAYLFGSWRREVQRLRSSRRNLEIQVEHRTAELEERNRQLQELNVRLQEASITDPLTGLLNRRSFYEFVSREVARVERSYTGHGDNAPALDDPNRRLLFFMMIDLDAFKPINDTFGHHTGDHTLVQVSDLLRACARDADTVFRWGGDEFLVIGQVSSEDDMVLLAERFRKTIAEHRFDPKYGKALRLSASIGVAPYPFCPGNPGIAAWEQVADVADLAAYLAKTHGKNAWVSTRGAEDLTAMQMQRVKDNFELLIETRKIIATSSETTIPIPGATRTP
ncbi:MAG: two-component regulator propeller domain-containing protein, partial [Pseudomonadales bacterium]